MFEQAQNVRFFITRDAQRELTKAILDGQHEGLLIPTSQEVGLGAVTALLSRFNVSPNGMVNDGTRFEKILKTIVKDTVRKHDKVIDDVGQYKNEDMRVKYVAPEIVKAATDLLAKVTPTRESAEADILKFIESCIERTELVSHASKAGQIR